MIRGSAIMVWNASVVRFDRVEVFRRPEPQQHRQECLCHIDPAVLAQLAMKGRASVAQTLLSVLVQEAAPDPANPFLNPGTFRERLIGMRRQVPWKPVAIVTSISTVLLSLLLLPACCCVKGPLAPIAPAAAPVISPMGAGAMPTPTEAAAKAPTQTLMRNVWFRIDQDAFLDIHSMRGELVSNTPGAALNFDNKLSF